MKTKTRILALATMLLLAAAAPLSGQKRKAVKKTFTHETVSIPRVEARVIAVETPKTSLIFTVRPNGELHHLYYGAHVPASEFSAVPLVRGRYSRGVAAYPVTGGRYLGEPALHIRYADGSHNTELYYTGHTVESRQDVVVTTINLKDYVTNVSAKLIYEAYAAEDVITERVEITNGGTQALTLQQVASSALSLQADQYLLSHVNGAWAQEMQLESELLRHGTKVIETRRGVQTAQCSNPSFLLSLNTAELREDETEVIGGALAWSGNYRLSLDIGPDDRLDIVSGVSPFASAYPLQAGEVFRTPEMIWTHSLQGAGGVSRNLHRWSRKYAVYGGGNVNPILLNSWEGAYFDFTTQTLTRMMDDAVSMGLEMFVLDDGWFGNAFPRNNDKMGLGDWQVNQEKLPEGIDYLASYAHSKGLRFGIWIEPEMVNPKSELAQAHPEWVVQSPGRDIPQRRHQWVLDLSNPAVQDFVFGVFDGIMQIAPSIDYIKWDCNRPVESFGSPYLGAEQDKFFIDYVQGFYRVMARVREKYPQVVVQCCSSGGARVDYGSLKYFNEVWTSDDTDALERVFMQYGTSLIYPACIMASHVSTVPNHQTRNVTPLKFRFDVACQGRLGLELQPRNLSEEEMALVRRCVASYKGYRDIVFQGDLYRLGSPFDGSYYGLLYVLPDKSKAVLFTYCIRFDAQGLEGHSFRLKGLDPAKRYKVTEQNVDHSCWWGNGDIFSGAFLQSGAFNPSMPALYSSAIFVLEAE